MNPADPFPPRSHDWPPTEAVPSAPGNSRTPDPGSPRRRSIALGVLLLAFALVVGMQQMQAAGPPPDPAAKYQSSDLDMFSLVARGMTKIGVFLKQNSSEPVAMLQENVDSGAQTPVDRFRAAIVAAELEAPEGAVKRFETLAESLKTEAPAPPEAQGAKEQLLADTELLRGFYAGELTLDDPQQKTLIDRYGWFGQLAATYGEKPIQRSQLFDGAVGIMLLTVLLFLGAGSLVIASLICLVLVILRLSERRFRPAFVPPEPGGSVYLETAAVFAAGFLGMHLLFMGIDYGFARANQNPPQWLPYVRLATQWILLLAIFWPRTQGVSAARWRADTGLNLGQGFMKEAGCGLLIYLASLPLLLLAGLLSYVLKVLQETAKAAISGRPPEPATPHNAILDFLVHGDPLMLALLFVLATTWAPLVEETIFRGCFFRHARSRVNWLGAGLISALLFGGMHGYEWVMLLPVITLGFVFSAMREWRGSLVGSITCHLLHNCTVLVIAISFIYFVK